MPGAGTLPLLEYVESRNSPAFLDERDEPELRDASEPLEVLKLELEALKLGQVESSRDMLADPSWERVQSVRDALAAEIEVRKRQKRGHWKSKEENKPDPIIESEAREGPPCPRNSDASFRGTEDNPIPATKSLEQSSKAERKRLAIMERRAATKSLPNRKPPLVPRPRPYSSSSSSSSPSTSPPPQTPLLLVKQQVQKPELASSSPQAKNPVLTNNNAVPETRTEVAKKSEPPKSIRPIVIEALDPVPGEYNVPIFVDDGEDPVVLKLEPNYYSQANRVVVAPSKALGEKTHSLNSSLMKSAYSNAESDADWPEELQVTPKYSVDVIDLLTKIYSEEAPGYLVDLSQMDADELEAEYARLVNGRGHDDAKEDPVQQNSPILSNESASQDMTERQATSNDESTVFPLVGSRSKDKEKQKEKEDKNDGNTNATGVEEPDTVTIIPSTSEGGTVKVKPLDCLRQKSMVCSMSSGEQDLQSIDGVEREESGQPSPVNNEFEEEKDVNEAEDKEPHEATEKVMENSMFTPLETRTELPETLHRSSSVGQEPPATLRQYYSRSRSVDDGVCSASDADEESLSYASTEEEYSKTDGRNRGTIEHDQYSFVSNDKGRTDRANRNGRTTRNGRASKSTRKKHRSDYSYIESVVAEYFGAKKNRLTENGACDANSGYKNTVFTDTGRGCGCSMAFQ